MKQEDLITLISKDTNLRYDAVRKVLRKLTKYMCVAIEQDEPVRFGLGTFTLKKCPPKEVQNFLTGKRYLMGPINKIIFSPSAYVKTSIKKADVKLQEEYEAELKNNGK